MLPSEKETSKEEFEQFLNEQIDELKKLEGDLYSWMKECKIESLAISFDQLAQPEQLWIRDFTSKLCSTMTTTFQGLAKVPLGIVIKLRKLINTFLNTALSLLNRILKLANIDSITINIAVPPSVSITLKP